ncbi:MAG: Mg(2+) transport ATPase, P-type [Humibacillus sp.]|nr:Mg(2+) transport ATPase, P-type [Humibacillus sp.]
MPTGLPPTLDRRSGAEAPGPGALIEGLSAVAAGSLPVTEALARLGTTAAGLTVAESSRRLLACGPNAVRTHHVRPLRILGRQLRSAILILLALTAAVSFALGQRNDTIVIGVILILSIGLGFANEYRAERATEALHSSVRHYAVTLRDGSPVPVEVAGLVPGDVVRLRLGEVVPADLRVMEAVMLECDESVLTGESVPAVKQADAMPDGAALAEQASVAHMGTVVSSGSATGVVVATGARTEFGRIALGLGERQPETSFQVGLRHFSMLLLQVALALTTAIFAVNLLLHRPVIESMLFSLAIAVGLTPQLLPAVISTSLATGSRQLARRKVLVKRLVCIEDLGDMDVLVTDKTGTLTEGQLTFDHAVDAAGSDSRVPLGHGLLATEVDLTADAPGAVGGNPLDAALWGADGAASATAGYIRLGLLPFDHTRMMTAAVVRRDGEEPMLVVKGSPESVLPRCVDVPVGATATLQALYARGNRVIAVASRPAGACTQPTAADERSLALTGFLVFLDPPKAGAAESLRRLATMGVAVKICSGDSAVVAAKVCADLGLRSGGELTGADVAGLDDDELAEAAHRVTIFARVSPQDKARIVAALRRRGRAVGFLGDGVNDALALHAADVGISVDTATDVAKDAADIVLLEKDLAVLADGVTEGRRIFANTIKYVLMGTSSNFGNMFSAAAASAVLPFLPMLPSQILLNNMLYDSGQLAIPTDRVDSEQLQAPSHWDLGFIRRFMFFFGPISSLFDFVTFAVMLGVFDAGTDLFRTGWFVESLATQTLVIFAIRTRRSPFTRSRPSRALLASTLSVVAIGIALPLSPFSHALGFVPLPAGFFLALVAMVVAYLVLIEVSKRLFFAEPQGRVPHLRRRGHEHHRQRRAARFSVASPLHR